MTIETQCPNCKKSTPVEVVESEYRSWKAGQLIQRAMPSLPESDREKLITGTCDPCWDEMFAEDEIFDEDDDEVQS